MAYQRFWVVSALLLGLVFQIAANTVNLQGTFSCTGKTIDSVATSSTVSTSGDISSIFFYMKEYYLVSRIFCGFICEKENGCDAMTYNETNQVCKLYFWNGQSSTENFLNPDKCCWKPQVPEMTSSTISLATTVATSPTSVVTNTSKSLSTISSTSLSTTSSTPLSTTLSTSLSTTSSRSLSTTSSTPLSTTKPATSTISTTTASTLPATTVPKPLGIDNCKYGSNLTTYGRDSISCPRLSNCTCDKGVNSSPRTGVTKADVCFSYCANNTNCLGFSYYTGYCYIATLTSELKLVASTNEFACYCQK